MNVKNIIKKALEDMASVGHIKHYKTIGLIKENFDQISNDYDFKEICLDCHLTMNDYEPEENADKIIELVSGVKKEYRFNYHLDRDEFSHKKCDICNGLSGERFFYIFFN